MSFQIPVNTGTAMLRRRTGVREHTRGVLLSLFGPRAELEIASALCPEQPPLDCISLPLHVTVQPKTHTTNAARTPDPSPHPAPQFL